MAASGTPSLAGRLRNRLRRSIHRSGGGSGGTGWAVTAAASGTAEYLEPAEPEDFSELHPDLDDCAELSELLLPTGDESATPDSSGSGPGSGPMDQATKELQAQLVALAIENEALRARADRAESELVAGLRRQLAAEQAARRLAEAGTPGRLSRAVNRLRGRRPGDGVGPVRTAETPPEGVDLESLESSDSDNDEVDGAAEASAPRTGGLFGRVRVWTAGRLLDLMEDLQLDTSRETASAATAAEVADGPDAGPPLSARRLKANAARFTRNGRPLIRCLRGFRDITRWRSPSYTVLVGLVYFLALRHDMILPLVLLLCIARLGLNYLKYRRHWNIEFNFLADYDTQDAEATAEKERKVGTQVNFVVQVARKVQNLTGRLSDGMEKLKNLVTWRSPRHTRTLLNALIAALAITLVLPASTCLFYAGLYLGVKLLLLEALFARYPRLKRRHDSFSRLWRSLPTDQQLTHFDAGTEDRTKYILPNSAQEGGTPEGSPLASDDEQFCQAFALPDQERPLPAWRGGKRCAIICKDSERSLALPSSLKHGRLFLTRSFLCFERSRDRGKAKRRNLVIPLSMMRRVRKAKAVAWLPGGGMSIEVQIVGVEKPVTFGAIIGRDEAFESLAEAGRKAGFAWAEAGAQQQPQPPADPQLVQAVSQALMSDNDMDE